MATINSAQLKVTLAKDRSGKLRMAATERAESIFEGEVELLKERFNEHPVTQEIDGGIDSENLSHTLVGGSAGAPKNLYAFIGFNGGDEPTQAIREMLDPTHPAGPKLSYVGRSATAPAFTFKVKSPDLGAIKEATPMPWGKGMSWAQKIETYIPGFAYFLARYGDEASRSGGGIQATVGGKPGGAPQKVRNAEFHAPAEGYLTRLFRDFLARVKSSNRSGGRRRDEGGRFSPF